MNQIQVLLPFGLPPAEFAPDLLRSLNVPSLSTLIARAKLVCTLDLDPFARALPHETWLAERLGVAKTDNSPALAASRMQAMQLKRDGGYWFILQPVHIHIARDHLVLTDQRRTAPEESESRALFDSALPLFKQAGQEVLYGDARTWFLRADDWQGLQTATPDAACGHNVDIWMPKGHGERAWRKLQNEIQMEWHEHAVNIDRAEHRLPAINSLWLWGGSPTDAVCKEGAAVQASGYPNLSTLLTAAPTANVITIDQLTEASLAEDWGTWLAELHALEESWFAPLLQALRSGSITQLKLIVGHGTQLREFAISKLALHKFWAKPALTRLLP